MKDIPLGHVTLAIFFLAFGSLYFGIGFLRYTFILSFDWAIVNIFTCAIIIFLTIKGMTNREKHMKNSTAVAISLPLLALFFVLAKGSASDITALHILLLSYVSVICAIILFFSCTRGTGFKITFSIIYALILVPMFLFSIVLLFGSIFMRGFVLIEVTSAELSPNATYLAEVIRNDQGALGGHTTIEITEQNRDINLLIGELQRNPRKVYFGRWWEYKYMSLYWESDDILYVYLRDGTIRFLRQGRNWTRDKIDTPVRTSRTGLYIFMHLLLCHPGSPCPYYVKVLGVCHLPSS